MSIVTDGFSKHHILQSWCLQTLWSLNINLSWVTWLMI